MRKIEILRPFNQDRTFAEKFIAEGHRVTKKKLPHLISFTFNQGSLDERRMKEINYIIDLFYQAFIMKNDIDRMIINIDKRQKNYLNIGVA